MRKATLVAIATAGAVIGLAACGGISTSGGGQPSSAPSGAPSAQTLVNDALKALKSAKSVRIAGSIVQRGKHLRLNVGFHKSGSMSGTMSGPFAGTQATFKLIVTGGKAYVLIDRALFNVLSKAHGIPASACSTLCGKYIAAPAGRFGNFSLRGLTHSMLKGKHLKGKHKVPSGDVMTTTVNGQPAYRFSAGHGVYFYVAENDTHYPLEFTKTGEGTLRFTQWNSVPPVTAPPSSQVIHLPGL